MLMKIVGLITEYNPFHNGHKYHIEKAKEITGADYCIAVMSGDFVQRGAPAFLPKHLRAEMALNGGCDMIIELPVCYATGSAEYFAAGAITILNRLGCVDSICFGSECGDYNTLKKIAQVIADEPHEYKMLLQKNLKSGMNYPAARQCALDKYFNNDEISFIIKEPNNILGIEYIKAMLLQNSNMKGYTITREDSSYHDADLSVKYSSASSIRNVISNSDTSPDFTLLNNHLNTLSIDLLKNNYGIRYPIISDDFSLLLRCKLLSETRESLTKYMDVSTDLANRIINFRNEFLSISQFTELLKTRELTYSRISRCLMHILLNIQDCKHDTETYAHVLGFRKNSSELFSVLKKHSEIPLLTKLTALESLNENQHKMIKQDIYSSDLYESIVSHKFNKIFINELTKQIVKC